jgi:hypothetical protein
MPPVQPQLSSTELVAVHSTTAAAVAAPAIDPAAASTFLPADLPVSIPHRILHCSWII